MHLSKPRFIFILIAIHALYFIGSVFLKTYMNNDSIEYLAQAKNMVEHGSLYCGEWDVLPHNPSFYTLRPPLYGLLVMLTAYLTSNAYILLLVQSVFSIFVWLMIRKALQRTMPKANETMLHLIILIGLLLNPVQLVLCNSIFSDILFQTLITLAFIGLLNFINTKESKYFLYYTAFCVLALLTKPALVYFAYVNILFSIYCYVKIQKKISILISSLVLPLMIFMISTINKNVTGYYHFSASKVENLWTYNTTNFLNMKYGNDSGYTYKKDIWKLSKAQPDYEHQYKFVDSACTHVLKENIISYTVFHAQGVLNFFIAPGREFINGYLDRDEANPKSFIKELNVNGWSGVKIYFESQPIILFIINILVTLWNLLLLVGLVLFTFSRKAPINLKIIALLLILYLAGVSSLAIGTARYKLAIYPILIFCNAYYWLKFSIFESRILKDSTDKYNGVS